MHEDTYTRTNRIDAAITVLSVNTFQSAEVKQR